ncbi:ligand-binding sensor domain-containing protein [Flavobacterium kingsejongi]|uniref:Histidine kinase n=1 Tax=Flavobacterium kingsejongi TaxID=1678728 RepID=A0A2S1LSX5_9FLAO|nr:histidine kinase [Flavobacterium kingsejongi]AWG26746.1 histidine kinase [Flavobacterium kingsejongi]
MRINVLKIFLFLLISFQLQAQQILPFVENFSKSDYKGDNQVWNVAQGNDNAMYFANNHYLLRYDGVKWEKYILPNKTIIRSIFVDGDRIYCGSYKEFGYWKRIKGKMQYFSMSKNKKLFDGNADNEEIWKIFKLKNTIYFQGFNEIYCSTKEAIEKIKFPTQISYCYVIDNQIYAASVTEGIYVMEGSKFTKKQNWGLLEHNVVHNIEKHNGVVYFFTKNNGVFVAENNTLVPWNNPLNALLKSQVIVTAKFIDGENLVIGTGLQGLYIIDLKTNSYKNINRENSLKNNAVLSITIDREKDLWLGLDNGISHIEINSPVRIFSDNSGILGSVYALSTIDNGYLFVTNHGIFTSKDNKLAVIPNSQGQVWDIYKSGKQFIIGHNDGTYIYDGNTSLRKINTVSGGWKILKSEFDNAYFQCTYFGIAVYENPNDLTKWKILKGFSKPIRNIAQNKPGELWAADNYRSLYRIQYDENYNTTKIENISEKNGIKNDYTVKLFNYKNEMLFLINRQWYNYNSISEKLELNVIFNKYFQNFSDIVPIEDDSFLVARDGLLYIISQVNDEFIWQFIPEKYYEGKLIIENTKVHKDKNNLLINLDDGFVSLQLNKIGEKVDNVTIEAFYQGNLVDEDTKISYNQSVDVNIIPEYYGYSRPNLFYTLNGTQKMIRVKSGRVILNNLSSGTQEINVFYNDGKNYIRIAEYHFSVAKPWYFSFWMILVYCAVISGSFYLYYKWNKIRYQQKLLLREEELKHQKKILEIELKAENELNIQEYEKHILELQVQSKSSEVAGKSLSIAKQTEMIEKIQEILNTETDLNKMKDQIKKSIKINDINKHEWDIFENNLFEVNKDFIQKLSKKYPVLTPKDIKLCIYLKMNLSSKEIAPLMNISYRGVELQRYRLRKKLELAPEENLLRFMFTI